MSLKGKVAVVTGGNGGIGLGFATGLAQAGADIAIWARNIEKSEAAVKKLKSLGINAKAFNVDVADKNQINQGMIDTEKEFGGVDILVANAGINIRKAPENYLPDEVDRIIKVNLTGVFDCCQAVYPSMKKRGGGKIITVGSLTSVFGFGIAPIYSATKGAVVQLTMSLANSWGRDNIQVNSVLPGWIKTELTEQTRSLPDFVNKVLDRTPAGRWGEPIDFAGIAKFLGSSDSDFITGVAIPVDGGFTSTLFLVDPPSN
ncbi:MAG: glucose 1-dehydrogenase [Candidatus Nanopelagicus sp.]|jgi:2-deoxy-D-gluconate 3-dehydrogenase|nr:glucose 1-dehydrogenase [Candidatus Nanopelagicus sp.]